MMNSWFELDSARAKILEVSVATAITRFHHCRCAAIHRRAPSFVEQGAGPRVVAVQRLVAREYLEILGFLAAATAIMRAAIRRHVYCGLTSFRCNLNSTAQ